MFNEGIGWQTIVKEATFDERRVVHNELPEKQLLMTKGGKVTIKHAKGQRWIGKQLICIKLVAKGTWSFKLKLIVHNYLFVQLDLIYG